MDDPRRVAILISGRGTNMRALVSQAKNYEVVLIASNKPRAAGLDWAHERGLATWAVDSKGVDKEEFDRRRSKARTPSRSSPGSTTSCATGWS
jgi:phosphoribosylglycinamide formyltransferase-1